MSDANASEDSLAGQLGASCGSSTFGSRAIPSDESSDDSTEAYREKIESLKLLIRNLNRQLESEKIRNRALDAITGAIQEERNRNHELEKELKTCKLKLEALMCKPHEAEPSSAVTTTLSGTSELSSMAFESLQKENNSLKQELRYLTVDPDKMDKIMKERDLLKTKLINLAEEMKQMDEENNKLKKILAMSPDEKQQEISKLIGQLEELKQKGKLNDVLCSSLSDQITVLQQRLHETNTTCQRLLAEMRKPVMMINQNEATSATAKNPNQPSSLPPTIAQMKVNSPESKTSDSEEKVKELEAQLKELFHVNQKWKEYNDKRNLEFQELKQELEELKKKQTQSTPLLSEKQQEQIDRLVLQYKKQIDGLETDKEKILDENQRLRLELNSAVLNATKLENRLKQLLEQKQNAQSGGASSSTNEQIQLLQWQVKTFSEDFEQEKRDRVRAEYQVKELERQINAYRTRIASVEKERQEWLQNCGHHRRYNRTALIQCDDDIDLDSTDMPPESSPPLHLISRGMHQSDNGEGYDEVDMVDVAHAPKTDLKSQQCDVIKCPECLIEYPKSCHSELLQHMNKCLN